MGKHPIKKHSVSEFSRRVYSVVSGIPRGSVMTYAAVARAAGFPRAARAVGSCMKKNTDPRRVPCHRVVRSDGSIGGYAFGGAKAKTKLLKKEGAVIFQNKIVERGVK